MLEVNKQGVFTLSHNGLNIIENEPLGYIFNQGKLYAPVECSKSDNAYCLKYEAGSVELKITDKGVYFRIEITGFQGGCDGFIFGPYKTPLPQFGEYIGAAYDSEHAVCIQSLNPKTIGGFPAEVKMLHPYINELQQNTSERADVLTGAAQPLKNGSILQCYVSDMRKERRHDYLQMKNAEAAKVFNEQDASPVGSAIALFACGFDRLLDTVGEIELSEGLPHPTINGQWSKKSKYAAESYVMCRFNAETFDNALERVKKTGLKCIYHECPFTSWGHFLVDKKFAEGGDDGLKNAVEKAKSQGIDFGFHTLSNFIHTNDSYVTPVPSEHLLTADRTVLTADLNETDSTVYVRDLNNFMVKLPVNLVRIDTELIKYDGCEETGGGYRLLNCERGAFGTKPASYTCGAAVNRLWSHGYGTLFPDFEMQKEMSERVAGLGKYVEVKRMSFDGLEGCEYLGRGEYACSEYVRRCYEIWGSEVLSDASIPSHYRWHAHTYFNWGEPFYDSDRRSGMFYYRKHNQALFKRNFIPPMLGQYSIQLAGGRMEATSPENFELMLSQSIAHNAGFGLYVFDDIYYGHGLCDYLLSCVGVWNDLRFNGDIPDSLREQMKDLHADWHVEKAFDGWNVSHIITTDHDFPYCSISVNGRSGENVVLDDPVIRQVLNCRVRVGTPLENGEIRNPGFYHIWGGYTDDFIEFEMTAKQGEYLIYKGGMELEHRDRNYNLIETVKGKGNELYYGGTVLDNIVFAYDSEDRDKLSMNIKVFRITQVDHINRIDN